MKNTKYNWVCEWCNKRNIDTIVNFQFDAPKYYYIDYTCAKCGKQNRINITLTVSPIYENNTTHSSR